MKQALVLLLVIFVAFGCNKKKIEQLEGKGDSLTNEANLKDQKIIDFLEAFNEIQDNLDSIKQKEMIIDKMTSGQVELNKEAKDQINDDINLIYKLLLENKQKLSTMKSKLNASNAKIVELEKMVERLTVQMTEKDTEIATLKGELEKLNIQVNILTKDIENLTEDGKIKSEKIDQQANEIDMKTTELNTAYFIVGTKKELIDNNIVTKDGGFIGIGAVKKLKSDFNENLFTKVDITKISQVAAPGKKYKILTNHPSTSFKVTGEGKDRKIDILNYKDFWKSSKYLVIMAD